MWIFFSFIKDIAFHDYLGVLLIFIHVSPAFQQIEIFIKIISEHHFTIRKTYFCLQYFSVNPYLSGYIRRRESNCICNIFLSRIYKWPASYRSVDESLISIQLNFQLLVHTNFYQRMFGYFMDTFYNRMIFIVHFIFIRPINTTLAHIFPKARLAFRVETSVQH